MQPDGSYLQRMPDGHEPVEGSHRMLIARSEKRLKEAVKQKSGKKKSSRSLKQTK